MDIYSLNGYEIILASGSPRRKDFLNQIGFHFTIKTFYVEESFPNNLKGREIADYIVAKKSGPFKEIILPKQIVITADTIVWCENEYLGKPKDEADAKNMLQKLSGKSHEVITAVGFLFDGQFDIITEVTEVHFKELSEIEIDQYISQRLEPMAYRTGSGKLELLKLMVVTQMWSDYLSLRFFKKLNL